MVAFNTDRSLLTDWTPDRDQLFKPERTAEDPEFKFSNLAKSIEASFRGMEWARNLNRAMVEQYAGPAYGNAKDKHKKYINKFHQAVEAYLMFLAANRPKVEVDTIHLELRAFAKHYETAMNNLSIEIGVDNTIRRWVQDAYFLMGIIKLHRKDSGLLEFEPDLWMDPGSPFASNVSLDNFVCDMGATSWSTMKWAGDSYRLPKKDIERGVETGLYDPEVAKEITPSSKFWQNAERLESFSKGEATDLDEYEPMVDLCDIWVKREQKIYTFVVTDRAKFCINPTPLAVMDWNNPEFGPYRRLAFIEVPENILPISPASMFDEMERLINSILRKQARQAMRQKEFTTYTAAGADAAKRVQRHNDGDLIHVTEQNQIGTLAMGGIHPANQAFLNELIAMFNDMAGNLPALLGTGPSAGTLGQEELIQSASNRKVGSMQSKVMEGVIELFECLGFDLWEDQFKELVGQMQVEGTDYMVDATWRPEDREGDFAHYNFTVNVPSMTYKPPAAQAQELIEMLGIYAQFEQSIAAQGGSINWAVINDRLATLKNQPVLKEALTFSTPAPNDDPGPQTSTGGTKNANTQRTYIRKSVPTGGTQQNQSQVRSAQWISMAGQNNPAQVASMGAGT